MMHVEKWFVNFKSYTFSDRHEQWDGEEEENIKHGNIQAPDAL